MLKNKLSKKILSLLIAAYIFTAFCNVEGYAAVKVSPLPELGSDSAVLYTINNSKDIISHNSAEKKYPVSMAKLMNAIIVIENADTGADFRPKQTEKVTVGYEIEAIGHDYKLAGFKVGDVVSVPDLLTAMIVCDADDAAIILARYIGRKVLGGVADSLYKYDRKAIDHFVDMMNSRAELIGLNSTMFGNATGFKGGHISFSTASDIARISAVYLRYPFLCEISRISSKDYWDVKGKAPIGSTDGETPELSDADIARTKLWVNQNELINIDGKYFYEGCKGVMASYGQRTYEVDDYNGDTKNDFVTIDYAVASAYVEFNGIKMIAVAYGKTADDVFGDITSMIEYVKENYVLHTYTESYQKVTSFHVENAMDPSNAHLEVITERGGTYLSRIDELHLFNHVIKINPAYSVPTEDNLYETYISPPAGITKGDIVGTMDIYYNAMYIDSVVLYAGNTVPVYEPLPDINGSTWEFSDLFKIIYDMGVVALIILILHFTLKIFIKIRRHKIEMRRYSGKRKKRPARRYSKAKRIR